MIKIFGTDDRVNFIDENNIFVGYELGYSCCEYADWYIGTEVQTTHTEELIKNRNNFDLSSYKFDISYFEDLGDHNINDYRVRFKLTGGEEPLYLVLFNIQNGYYSHGFEFKNNDVLIKEGTV